MKENKKIINKGFVVSFGVGMERFELITDNMENAYLAILLYISKNIPIAIYSPKYEALIPNDSLETSTIDIIQKNKINKILKLIKRVD